MQAGWVVAKKRCLFSKTWRVMRKRHRVMDEKRHFVGMNILLIYHKRFLHIAIMARDWYLTSKREK